MVGGGGYSVNIKRNALQLTKIYLCIFHNFTIFNIFTNALTIFFYDYANIVKRIILKKKTLKSKNFTYKKHLYTKPFVTSTVKIFDEVNTKSTPKIFIFFFHSVFRTIFKTNRVQDRIFFQIYELNTKFFQSLRTTRNFVYCNFLQLFVIQTSKIIS